MKYNKIIKLTGYVIVIHFFFIDTQYCSERPLCDFIQAHHEENYASEQYNRDAIRERYLDKYIDYDIVTYWTSKLVLQRIKANERSCKASIDEILDYVINLDTSLKDDKEDIKQMLYQKECNAIISNDKISADQKDQLYEYMQRNEEKIKDDLWLQHMYTCKDGIHKEIEKNKRVRPCQESYCAWPYIKEIARLRKFS